MKFLKFTAVIIVFVIGAFVFVINFSEVITKYECRGSTSKEQREIAQDTIYLKFSLYRWWVHLWSDNGVDGNLWVEMPFKTVLYFDKVQLNDAGDSMTITNRYVANEDSGFFSKLSNTILLRTNNSSFEGKCTEMTSD